MEKSIVLKGEIREKIGSKDASKLRTYGRIPAIVYGHKKAPVAVSLDAQGFIEKIHQGCRIVDVEIGKIKEKMLVKEVQYDYLGKDIIHVDLMRVDVTEMVKIAVPLVFKGVAKGIHEGGIVEVQKDYLEVECIASDIPENIVVKVSELGVGDSIHAKDIAIPEGIKLVSPPETLVAACHIVAAAKTTEEIEAEMPAAPEVITEAKAKEEEEEETEKER